MRPKPPGSQQGPFLSAPTAAAGTQMSDETALPEKAPQLHDGLNSKQNAILCGEYVANFFKQNVGRARDRNER